jgi:hypothetical protein
MMSANTRLAFISALAALTCAGNAQAQGKPSNELCNVSGLYGGLATEGPLKGCNQNDVVHFQVESRQYAYSSIVARFCNLDSEVVIEQQPGGSLVHVVCKYQWRWAKQVDLTKHPDAP